MARFDAEFVVTPSQILDEGMTADHRRRGPIRPQSAHRTEPCLEPAMVALDAVFAYWVVSWSTSGRRSSTTRSSGAARSVVTSVGRSRPANIISKNLVAAATLRRFETNTSMTWPVGAGNGVVAGHAAFRYSWMSPSQRLELMT